MIECFSDEKRYIAVVSCDVVYKIPVRFIESELGYIKDEMLRYIRGISNNFYNDVHDVTIQKEEYNKQAENGISLLPDKNNESDTLQLSDNIIKDENEIKDEEFSGNIIINHIYIYNDMQINENVTILNGENTDFVRTKSNNGVVYETTSKPYAMKLRNIYFVCKKNYVYLKKILSYAKPDYSKLMIILNDLAKIDFFKDTKNELADMIKLKEYESYDTKIYDKSRELLCQLKCVVDLGKMLGLKDDPIIGLDIKLPANCGLSELRSCISDLEFIFTECPFLKCEKGKWEYYNMDIGSLWITFIAVATSISIAIKMLTEVVEFINKCIQAEKEFLELKEFKKNIKNSKRDINKEVLDAINTIKEFCYNLLIQELEKNTGKKIENEEEKDKAIQSIDKMYHLLDAKIEVHLTIDTTNGEIETYESIEEKNKISDIQLNLIRNFNKNRRL